MNFKKQQFKNWWQLFLQSLDDLDNINELKSQRTAIGDNIFPDRMQPTKGFFRRKTTDFIVPQNFGIDNPCAVTIFRNAITDGIWGPDIINIGSNEDVKTFYCPNSTENAPCSKMNCKYYKQNHDYFDLGCQIIAAEAKHKETVQQRKTAWKQLWTRGK